MRSTTPMDIRKVKDSTSIIRHMYTFIVTTMGMEPYQVIQFYCGRGKMENFIKEGKRQKIAKEHNISEEKAT